MEEKDPKQLFIVKPSNQACGRGIKVINKKTKIKNKNNTVISKYIMNPHLINNRKYDLWVYIVVSGYDPLRIYRFHQGLVRFATHDYNKKDTKDRFSHLTNYSVNKKNTEFVEAKNVDDDSGSKWSYKQWIE